MLQHALIVLLILTPLMMLLLRALIVQMVRHVQQAVRLVLMFHHQCRHQQSFLPRTMDALQGPLNLALVVYVLHAPKVNTNL
jgi:hypothetical protein